MTPDHDPTRPESGFAYQPALDGVRGIAVAMVLLFHAGFGWMSGGYLGVSVFFTLSGFLITTLAIGEHTRTGNVQVGAFYARRIRRLLPASLACLLGISVLAMFGVFDDVPRLRVGLWGALAQVYNWVALAGGDSYEELVSAAAGTVSPVEHYWSLSIEEQFYWIWPVVLVVLLGRVASGHARTVSFAFIAVVAGLVAPVVASVWGADAAYWSTPARLAEILLGAALAVALADPGARRILMQRRIPIVGVIGLAAIIVAGITWPAAGGPAYEGWLPVFALASVALVAGLQVDSPLRSALAARPLVALGAISYGVYLYHWPVYTVIDPARADLSRVPLFAVRLIVTLALAIASYHLLERPIRRRRTLPLGPVGGLAAASCAAVAVVIAFAVPAGDTPYWKASAADQAAMRAAVGLYPVSSPLTSLRTAGAAGRSGGGVELSRPMRILVFGDSTASALGVGLTAWAHDHRDVVDLGVMWAPACDLVRAGEMVDDLGQYEDDCAAVHVDLADAVDRLRPDVVVVMTSANDVADRYLDGDDDAVGPGDPAFDELVHRQLDEFVERLDESGVDDIAWIKPPVPHPLALTTDPEMSRRFEWLWQMQDTVAARHPDLVHLVDLAGWDERQGDGARTDGLHLSPEAGYRFADEVLVPLLVGEVVS